MAKKKPTKVPTPERIKDPKKVAAGKARAKKAIRIEGRFVSNVFFDNVKKDAESAGVKDAFTYFMQHEKEYGALYETFMRVPTNRNGDQVKKDLAGYKGTIIVNGRRNKASTAIRKVAALNQYLRTEENVVAFFFKPELTLGGKMRIEIPTPAEIRERLENGENLEDIMDEYGMTAIQSSDKDNAGKN